MERPRAAEGKHGTRRSQHSSYSPLGRGAPSNGTAERTLDARIRRRPCSPAAKGRGHRECGLPVQKTGQNHRGRSAAASAAPSRCPMLGLAVPQGGQASRASGGAVHLAWDPRTPGTLPRRLAHPRLPPGPAPRPLCRRSQPGRGAPHGPSPAAAARVQRRRISIVAHAPESRSPSCPSQHTGRLR